MGESGRDGLTGARRFASIAAVWLCVVAGSVLFWSATAQALTVQRFAGSFGSEGSGSGQFREPEGIAVNDATHDVYVADNANDRVEEFDATGSTLIGEFNGSASPTGVFSFSVIGTFTLGGPAEIAVDNSGSPLDPSAGDVYVLDRGHKVIDKFSSAGVYEGQLTGTPRGPFEELGDMAVDPNGDLWVSSSHIPAEGQSGNPRIDSFNDALTNEYLSSRQDAFGGSPDGFALDSEDNIYLGAGTSIAKLNSLGETLLATFGSVNHATTGLAVDPIEKEIYVITKGSIEAYSLSGAPIERFGSGLFTKSLGVAVDASDGAVYVSNTEGDQVDVFNAITLPSVSLGALSQQQPRSVTLNGTVSPEGEEVTSCVFEYGTSSSYGKSVLCSPASPGSGTNAVAVSAHLTGLTPETVYHYRLVASNSNGPSPTADAQFTAGPVLGSESVANVADTSATLQAPIDANGSDAHYYFQYGPSVSYGSYAPAAPPGVDIGSGVETQNFSAHVQELEPSTVYYYRAVVLQGGEEFAEPDRTFTTQSAGGELTLPDGRAWELVSPPNKKGALIEPFSVGGQIQAASDGSGITYLSEGPAVGENPAGKFLVSQALSERGPDGWRSQDLTLPADLPGEETSASKIAFGEREYTFFSQNLSVAVAEPQLAGTPPLSPEATERTLYLRDDLTGSFTPLVTKANVPAETEFGGGENKEEQMHILDATPDLSHVVFASPLALTSEAVSQGERAWNLYEWSEGQLKLINILPDGNVAVGGGEPIMLAGENGHSNDGAVGGTAHVISNNGRRIAWTIGSPWEPGQHYGLYLRDLVEERTVQVGGTSAVFQDMNSDGSKLFYLERGELYEYDYATGKATDITADHGAGENSAEVQESVSDVSEDGSYVYFVAGGALSAGATGGEDNLYLAHRGDGGWTITFIATLSNLDRNSWYAPTSGWTNKGLRLPDVSSRVSPDGSYLAFMSERSLTGYDNTDLNSGQPDEEVYLYDAATQKLVCASCDPTGARPVGVLDTGEEGTAGDLLVDREQTWGGLGFFGTGNHWLAGSVPGWDERDQNTGTYQPRYLSDGGRLFFDSPDDLVPQATNGLENVYEYEPPASGETATSDNCTTGSTTFSVRSDGCVSLISAGTASRESAFYDASESGDDVFFITAAKLVSADYDGDYDVYDAHVCNSEGVPCVNEPVTAPPCTSGDSCKAAPSPQPEIFGPAPSATFSGVGNVSEEAKAQVRKKGKPKPKPKPKKKTKKKKRKTGKARKSRVNGGGSHADVAGGKGGR